MNKGVILQDRDFLVLKTVYEGTVSSFEELKRKHFSTTNLQTASNRLCRLVNAGFLRGYRVGIIMYQGFIKQVNRVYTITPLGIEMLALKFESVIIRRDEIRLQPFSLVHDLLLNNVSEQLKNGNPGCALVNSKLLKMFPSRTEQIPDLILKGENGLGDTAIELELTDKSEKRYREIITNYRLSTRYQKVLFIFQTDQIREKIVRVITGYSSHYQIQEASFGKFKFLKLSELIPQTTTKKDQPQTLDAQASA